MLQGTLPIILSNWVYPITSTLKFKFFGCSRVNVALDRSYKPNFNRSRTLPDEQSARYQSVACYLYGPKEGTYSTYKALETIRIIDLHESSTKKYNNDYQFVLGYGRSSIFAMASLRRTCATYTRAFIIARSHVLLVSLSSSICILFPVSAESAVRFLRGETFAHCLNMNDYFMTSLARIKHLCYCTP